MLEGASVPIIIVGYRNPGDVVSCLRALARMPPAPSAAILVCENGGPEAYDALLASLTAGPCSGATERAPDSCMFRRAQRLRLNGSPAPVIVAEAVDNLGYAGGINAWLEPLALAPGWEGVWILNPDAAPWPSALEELVKCANARKKGMVGSRVMVGDTLELVDSRGLRWMKWKASTRGVDLGAPAAVEPDPSDIEARINSPTGASFYVTRRCIERIGLMDERFFLYFEELDWGLRARDVCGVRLRIPVGRAACGRNDAWFLAGAGFALAAGRLPRLPQPAALCRQALSLLVPMDPVDVRSADLRIPGRRFCSELLGRSRRTCGRLARRNRATETVFSTRGGLRRSRCCSTSRPIPSASPDPGRRSASRRLEDGLAASAGRLYSRYELGSKRRERRRLRRSASGVLREGN